MNIMEKYPLKKDPQQQKTEEKMTKIGRLFKEVTTTTTTNFFYIFIEINILITNKIIKKTYCLEAKM